MTTRQEPRSRNDEAAQGADDSLDDLLHVLALNEIDVFSESDEYSNLRDSSYYDESEGSSEENLVEEADSESSSVHLSAELPDESIARCKEVQLLLKKSEWIKKGDFTFVPKNDATRKVNSMRNARPFNHSQSGPVGHQHENAQEHALSFLEPFVSFLSRSSNGTPSKRKRQKPVQVEYLDVLKIIAFEIISGIVQLPTEADYFNSKSKCTG